MGVLQGGGEPEDEVPVRVVASEEVVSDVELDELAVDRLPGSLPVAVSEGGVELDGFGVAAAGVEALGVGESAALTFGVDLEAIGVHPGREVLEGARPGSAQTGAKCRTSIGEKMACIALPKSALRELRSALESCRKSSESRPRT